MVLRSKNNFIGRSLRIGFLCACGAGFAFSQASAQSQLPLQDFSSFKNAGKSWQIVGDVNTEQGKENSFKTTGGTGILVNQPTKKAHGEDLFFNLEHGDIDLELEYMMAAGANSGIYLQGRYELQLLDSWGTVAPKPGDNGGIYERWDDSKPEGQKGYQGYAPRQNASKAPGLWQKLRVSFQAPRFDASGKKISNAKMLRVELNGVLIHENIELSGPTRGAVGGNEVAAGPLRIQGDHGAVAFRNIIIKQYDKARPELSALQYKAYKGRYSRDTDYSKAKAEATGTSNLLTANASHLSQEYTLVYKGTLNVKEAGEYQLEMAVQGGNGFIIVDGKPVRNRVTLPAGNVPVEIIYSRTGDWGNPTLGLNIAGPGVRSFYIGDVITPDDTDPIILSANTNTILRSFIDVPGSQKITHAVSVGSPLKVNYTYDLDHGMLVQVWRGEFLETTPMWHERGNGTSRPMGALQRLGKPFFQLGKLAGEQAAWTADSTGSGYRPKGYVLDEQDRPTFKYQVYGASVNDQVRVSEDGHGIVREISVTNAPSDLYAKLAEGAQIESIGKDLYLVDGKAYFLQVQDAGGAKPLVRESAGVKELIVPVRGKLSYSILF
ncbi:DUF1080 domain-containing protein [Chitinophaga horti]|uniref:DUF1080 domain-containing protein n=1 Tax=Chitinophaga horti TaxID=2920382 RepID=A0ABY6J687_9BACT|nr:DUF1080 domain-containing protein [Chitinophaga horti]UYQ95020.1 DUF1080 domain-containing protein [Chitinophaga horti]